VYVGNMDTDSIYYYLAQNTTFVCSEVNMVNWQCSWT